MDPQGRKVGLALFGMSATRQPDAADGSSNEKLAAQSSDTTEQQTMTGQRPTNELCTSICSTSSRCKQRGVGGQKERKPGVLRCDT